jgi:hypothetical protein
MSNSMVRQSRSKVVAYLISIHKTYPEGSPSHESYRHSLEACSDGDLFVQYDKAVTQEAEQRKRNEEASHWFNQPTAIANFEHWSKAVTWTLDEAVALSFGLEPCLVNWDKLAPLATASEFAQEYAKKRDLIQRAELAGQISSPTTPNAFIVWSQRVNITVDQRIVDAVVAHGELPDYKSLFDDATKQLARAQTERTKLDLQLEAKRSEAKSNTEKKLSTKERKTLLLMIYTMATRRYQYDGRGNSSLPELLAPRANELGEQADVSITGRTIRNKLKEAHDLFSGSD